MQHINQVANQPTSQPAAELATNETDIINETTQPILQVPFLSFLERC